MNRKIIKMTAIILTMVVVVLSFTCCKYDTNIESVNIHYSGGFSGRHDADLTVYRKLGKYYIRFRTTNQGITSEEVTEYEITREEFVKCTDMIDTEKLKEMQGLSGCDMIYRTVTIKEKGKAEIELPRISLMGVNPYSSIENLYSIKTKGGEENDGYKFDLRVWKCFKDNRASNGYFTTNDQESEMHEGIYGFGFGMIYKSELDNGFGEINGELISEIEMVRLYETGKIDSLDLDQSVKERRDIISSAGGSDFQEKRTSYHVNREDILFFRDYPNILFRRGIVSENSMYELLDQKYDKTTANGKKAYTRTVVSDDRFAVIVIIPEEAEYMVYASDSYSSSYAKKITKLLLEQLSKG